ncbi:hypothetical protein [Methylovorus glucosotrophus]|uniref:hypothetical protein n=1 Tax=Methylovorus glucosotrophus TaxID=266009 RepID=UPI0011D062E2|nr:hypothetical protein [Methylovorus glucosotrophus]
MVDENISFPQADSDLNAVDQHSYSEGVPHEVFIPENPGLPVDSLGRSLLEASQSKRNVATSLIRMAAAWAEDKNTLAAKAEKEATDAKEEAMRLREENTQLLTQNATLIARSEAKHINKPLVAIAHFATPTIATIGLDEIKDTHWGVGLTLLVLAIFMGVCLYTSVYREAK